MRRALVLATVIACGKSDVAMPIAETWWCNPKIDKDDPGNTCATDKAFCERDTSAKAKAPCVVVDHPYCFTRNGSATCFIHVEACVLDRQRWVDIDVRSVGSDGCFQK